MAVEDAISNTGIFTRTARFLHWGIAAMVFGNLFFGFTMDGKVGAELQDSLVWHTSAGVLVLVFVFAALVCRKIHSRPEYPSSISRVQKRLAGVTHGLLYILLLLVPLTGLITAAAHVEPVVVFGVWDLRSAAPVLSSEHFDLRLTVHWIAGSVLALLVIAHVAAALLHQFYYKDSITRRMTW